MEDDQINSARLKDINDIVFLIYCALHGNKPDSAELAGLEYERLYQFSAYHSIEAIVYMSLEGTNAIKSMEPGLAARWKEAKEMAILKNMLFNEERKHILEDMEAAGIWYLPLKGIIMQECYPKFGMRQMADNDILYDKSRQKDLIKIMKLHGYDVKSVGKGAHDIFMKKPMYNFEMHTQLFPIVYKDLCKYYSKISKKMKPDGKSEHGYCLSNEDFYIYVIAHEYKHFNYSGTGVRSLVDNYVYVQKFGDSLNWEYVNGELAKLKIDGFEKQAKALATKLFGDGVRVRDLSTDERAFLIEFARSGTYGTMERNIGKRLEGIRGENGEITFKDHFKYIWSRIFLDMDTIRMSAPICAKYKILIPFYLIFRFFRGVLFKSKKIMQELKILSKVEKKMSETDDQKTNKSEQ